MTEFTNKPRTAAERARLKWFDRPAETLPEQSVADLGNGSFVEGVFKILVEVEAAKQANPGDLNAQAARLRARLAESELTVPLPIITPGWVYRPEDGPPTDVLPFPPFA